MARVLVTRRLPQGGLDPLVDAGHEILGGTDDTPYAHEELVAGAAAVDAVVCLLTDRVDDEVLAAGAAGSLRVGGQRGRGASTTSTSPPRDASAWRCATRPACSTRPPPTSPSPSCWRRRASPRTPSATCAAGGGRGGASTSTSDGDVHGAVLGLVGYGRIGQAVARRAAGFGMSVLHHARHDTEAPGYVAHLDDLLARADVVSLHVPLSDGTRHLLGARGARPYRSRRRAREHVEGSGRRRGGARRRPARRHPVRRRGSTSTSASPPCTLGCSAAPRTVLLPHIGSASVATRTRMARVACQGVCEVLAGRRPENLVTL